MVIDTWHDPPFLRRIVGLARRIFGVPVAVCTSGVGVSAAEGVERISSLGQLPFELDLADFSGVFAVTDAAQDPRFRSEPAVAGTGGIRFFAAACIQADQAGPVRLSIMDFVPHAFDAGQSATLLDLAESAHDRLFSEANGLRALRRLAYGAGHDFSNLCTIINGYSSLAMSRTVEDDPIRESFEQIESALRRAGVLTDQLLRLSGRTSRPELLDLNDFLRSMEKMVRRLIGDQIELTLQMHPDIGFIHVDRQSLGTGILTLVARARDAMPEGGKLDISTGAASIKKQPPSWDSGRSTDFVLLTVEDSGNPMSDSILEDLFEPLADRGNPELPILRNYLKDIGGHIRISTDLGAGTRFELYFPRHLEPPIVSAKPGSKASKDAAETILVVDDDWGPRSLSRDTLRRFGYTVLEAEDAEQAVAAAKSHIGPIHLILTDVTLAGPSGLEVADAVVRIWPECKVIFMSGYTEGSLADLRGLPFLTKPFLAKDLVDLVRAVLRGGSGK